LADDTKVDTTDQYMLYS